MGNLDRTIRDFTKVLKESNKSKTSSYDTPAEVIRVEGETAWVHIPGGIDETPVKLTTSAKKGDTVQVRVSGGRAWLYGNVTSPPTDDTKAKEADGHAVEAKGYAVEAKDTAVVADTKATDAKETAESILVYDNTYSINDDVATFTAFLYRGGVDVKFEYSPKLFTWYLKTEEGEDLIIVPNDEGTMDNYGYSCSVDISDCGYGAEVIGRFTITDDPNALDANGDILTTEDGTPISVRASGESIRVRDLDVSTNLYSVEKLMVVGTSDEHLISVQTLQNYLNTNLDKQVLFNTTSGWNSQTTLLSKANTIYVYTDYRTDSDDNNIAAIKIGDGLAYLIDLPILEFVTNSERTSWNNKVSCYYTGTEELVFTTD